MFKIKKKDKVLVIAGKDKGKKGEVKEVNPDEEKVIVTGINIVSKHEKSRKDKPGGIIKTEAPIHVSNVQLICSKCDKPTRVKFKMEGDQKLRICKKCGEAII
jgi:large subunit ribosomal protein L24